VKQSESKQEKEKARKGCKNVYPHTFICFLHTACMQFSCTLQNSPLEMLRSRSLSISTCVFGGPCRNIARAPSSIPLSLSKSSGHKHMHTTAHTHQMTPHTCPRSNNLLIIFLPVHFRSRFFFPQKRAIHTNYKVVTRRRTHMFSVFPKRTFTRRQPHMFSVFPKRNE